MTRNVDAVCTLFEGHYHHGVAVLTNSLYAQGFRGDIYAGHRGELPRWTEDARPNESLLGCGGKTLEVADDLRLHFIPVSTNSHLTNYKPDFMLRMWDTAASNALNMFYFDPDIVVSVPWETFAQWVECGVALCEDVNSPLPENHPRRAAWRQYYSERGIKLSFKDAMYANGGFIGVNCRNQSFLWMWKTMQEAMAPAIGGLGNSALGGNALPVEVFGPFSPFGKTDQDALNAAIEAWDGKVSLVGKEGMSLKSGMPLIPHAVGQPKPWNWNPLVQAFFGRPPRRVDQEYWRYARGVLVVHSMGLVKQMLFTLKIASLIGRFYKRR
jgi:hypothetical protein